MAAHCTDQSATRTLFRLIHEVSVSRNFTGSLMPSRIAALCGKMYLIVRKVAFARGNYGNARQAYQAASLVFAAAGIGPEAELRMADCYLAEQNVPEARTRYQKLIASVDRKIAGEAWYSLAQTYQKENQLGLAAELASLWLAVPFAEVLGVEHGAHEEMPAGGEMRRYGSTAITFYRARRRGTRE